MSKMEIVLTIGDSVLVKPVTVFDAAWYCCINKITLSALIHQTVYVITTSHCLLVNLLSVDIFDVYKPSRWYSNNFITQTPSCRPGLQLRFFNLEICTRWFSLPANILILKISLVVWINFGMEIQEKRCTSWHMYNDNVVLCIVCII